MVIASLTAAPAGWSSVMGSISSGRSWFSGGTRSFLIVAMLCRMAHAATICDARSGDTLNRRRQLKRAFRMPKVISILTLVLLRATLNRFCGLV